MYYCLGGGLLCIIVWGGNLSCIIVLEVIYSVLLFGR